MEDAMDRLVSTDTNVFAGLNALLDFLDPGKHPPTPLVELPPALNPYHGQKVRVFMKLLFMTPIFNAKLLASRNLFDAAKLSGRLGGVHTLVENSSGNKILADAFLARLFGMSKVVAIVPHDIPPDKQHLLELFGVECRKDLGGIAKARELGKESGYWNPDQYRDEGNPGGSVRWLAPQLWHQTRGEITVFCAGLGTGGTMIGVSKCLKALSPHATMVGVVPTTNDVPGTRTVGRLEEVDQPWRDSIDKLHMVGANEAYYQSLRLCGRGILAGPSSGMALEGLYKHLSRTTHTDLDKMRNANGEVVAVVACPDSCMLYLDKYSTRLSAEQMVQAIA
jgi:cysteine synthase